MHEHARLWPQTRRLQPDHREFAARAARLRRHPARQRVRDTAEVAERQVRDGVGAVGVETLLRTDARIVLARECRSVRVVDTDPTIAPAGRPHV